MIKREHTFNESETKTLIYGDVDERSLVTPNNSYGLNSVRLKAFQTYGLTCVTCGCTAMLSAFERHWKLIIDDDGNPSYKKAGPLHLNLYAVVNGKERMMTVDHIKPKSKGGTKTLDNLQIMCDKCNRKKGNHYDDSSSS